MSLLRLRVFVLFSLGYFVSYVFRGVNLGFAPFITRDLGLSAADLGLLTSLYFLGFAGAQVPAGVLLDHFGARRVTAAMLLFAAAGAWVFGAAHGIGAMMLGRLLVGVGVSVCLGAAFKALAQHFPSPRLPFVNGLVMAVGGLGGVMVGSPLTWVLGFAGWRSVCVGLGVLTIGVSALIWLLGPKGAEPRGHVTLASQFQGTWLILRSPAFWKIASFSVVTQAVFFAMQSLWIGAWLRDVMHLAPGPAAALVSVLGFAMMAGCVGFGAAARTLERRGLSLYAFCGIGMALYVVTQLLIMFRAPLPAGLLWAAYGFFGGTGILSYAIAARHFPPQMTGRVNTTLTLVLFLLIFGFQLGVGAIVSHWAPDTEGHYPAAAHLTAWGILVGLQVASAIWYVLPGRAIGSADTMQAKPQL